jgi:hypothetical protein
MAEEEELEQLGLSASSQLQDTAGKLARNVQLHVPFVLPKATIGKT